MASTGDFPDALDPVFSDMFPEGEVFEGEGLNLVSTLYQELSSTRPEERLTSISGLPKAPRFTGSLTYKDPDQGYDVTITHITNAFGVQITRHLWDDDQHDQIQRIFEGFRNSFWETKQDDASDMFNQAFTANPLDTFNHTENVALCSNSHTTPVSGVSTSSGYDNLSTSALSATALAADRYTMRLSKNFQGIRIDRVPDCVFVPAELDDEALKITQTRVGLDTAAGDVNVQAGRYQVISSVRLTDTNNFFTINKDLCKRSLLWYTRDGLETDRMESFDQFNFKGRGWERYGYGWLFWQGIIGHSVS